MVTKQNSKLLNQMIDHAKMLNGRERQSFTAERFLLTVCDYLTGDMSTDDERSFTNMRKILHKIGVDANVLRAALLPYVREKENNPQLDTMYMSKILFAAQARVQSDDYIELTPEVMLHCLLEDPTDTIRRCILDAGGRLPLSDDMSDLIPEERAEKRTETDGSENHTESRDEESEASEGSGDKETSEFPVDPKRWEALIRSLSQKREAECEDGPRDRGNPFDDADRRKEPEPEREKEPEPAARIAELTEKVKKIRGQLLDTVFGQDNAVSVFVNGYFRSEILAMTDPKRVRPATFLFAGPPGVGKTFLAESAAKLLGRPFQVFDMSEYADHEANIEFCGSDKVYKNGKEGNVTGYVAEHPRCVLLFDEIEKAHSTVIHLFLQMLDGGRLRDNYTDKEVPFKDAIVIFTTNAGKQFYDQSESGDFSCVSRKVILNALKKDKNSETGVPFFPAALCSRFASGNVVMFNRVGAQDLCAIARREILRHAENFRREMGIEVEVDETVSSAILFAEGGMADARTVRARAEAFFDDELFELFRFASKETFERMRRIRVRAELPENDAAVRALFETNEKPAVLVFSNEETLAYCSYAAHDGIEIIGASDVTSATELLRKKDIQAVLVDIDFGVSDNAPDYLNREDVDSTSRDFLRVVRENYSDLPVYILCHGKEPDPEEAISYTRRGVRGILLTEESGEQFQKKLSEICVRLHRNKSMAYLAGCNKLVTYETAQRIDIEDGTAEILMFDFRLNTAIDAEDSDSILSNLSKPNVHFADVIGAEDAKKELQFFVDYLKNPKKYVGTGVRTPRGVILYGPPGTGKTMLAKAMACESGVTFIASEGNAFMKSLAGQGPDKVHEMFRTARKYAPAILFVDEIDVIAKDRQQTDNSMGYTADDVLTAFLAEMDGFRNDTSKPVFVLAATNYSVEPGGEKSLDPALMRRFDRKVCIDLPNKEERIRYIRMKMAGNPMFVLTDADVENIAIRTTGKSPAELELILELALRNALRDGTLRVTGEGLADALDTFTSGEEKPWDAELLERVSRHEAGHTLLCWLSGETPSYVTVVARGNYGGYMQHGDHEGKAIYTKKELLSRIRTSLGGRAAELVYYGSENGVSTGASGDLEHATYMAQQLLCTYGMDEEFGLSALDLRALKEGKMLSAIRESANRILSEELRIAVECVTRNKAAIDALVAELLVKNHLTGDEIDRIFRSAIPDEGNR